MPLNIPPKADHRDAPVVPQDAERERGADMIDAPSGPSTSLLLLSVFLIATSGLVYELIAGTLASYVLGDSVTQFSIIIGLYLSAMGLGAHLSRYIERGVARRFVLIELSVALVGGLSAPLLFVLFATSAHFRLFLYAFVVLTGVLVGLEIPLLMRILRQDLTFRDLVAQVLTFDYIGALVASILFPVLFMPSLGLIRTSLLFGLLNAFVGLWSTFLLRHELGEVLTLRVRSALVIGVLFMALVNADRFTHWMENAFYGAAIVYAKRTPYQRIVVTRDGPAFQLFLNGNLQFNSNDEYRYHEALVHPALISAPRRRRILICGGGDGLALREVLRYKDVQEVLLVDLDPAMTHLASSMTLFRELNGDAMSDPRVTVVNADAMVYLDEHEELKATPFDAAIVDFPDPNNYALGKLYTTHFYRLLRQVLAPDAVAVIQSTSPLMARAAYWSIVETLKTAGFAVRPYHLAVPSFGIWGYVLIAPNRFGDMGPLPKGLRFLNAETLRTMFVFPEDMKAIPSEVNRLNNQVLVHLYEREWSKWN